MTAQKREQSLLDVGIDISVISGEELARLRVDEIDDLSRHVSNMNVKNTLGATNPVVTIRGVGLNDFNANSNPTAGVYVDEVFLTSTAMMGFQLFDMERVEVLKGPQGTLYGRNTTAGAVSFVTRKPTPRIRSLRKRRLRRLPRVRDRGGHGRPAQRCAVVSRRGQIQDQGKGFSKDRISGDDFGAADRFAWRAQLHGTRARRLSGTLNLHGGRIAPTAMASSTSARRIPSPSMCASRSWRAASIPHRASISSATATRTAIPTRATTI